MFYSIRHLTRFRYKTPGQREPDGSAHAPAHRRRAAMPLLPAFRGSAHAGLRISRLPRQQVHHFDVPGQHRELKIVAEALVEIEPAPELPDRLEPSAWDELDRAGGRGRLLGNADAQPVRAAHRSAAESDRAAARPAPRRSAQFSAGAERGHLRLVRVRAQSHARRFAHRPCDRSPQGRLPGFRAHHDRAGAARQDSVPLRERLCLPALRASRSVSGRRDRTPGWRRFCRGSAGWDSTRPTI